MLGAGDPVDDWLKPVPRDRLDFVLKAAELHLARATSLAETEWKVSLAFWTVLLLSGASFIAYTNASTPPMIVYIAHSDILFLIPYLASAAIFVFGFSVNQARSIVQERTWFRYYVNEAAAITGDSARLPDADPLQPISITSHNRVWAQKLLSTFLFVTGIWGAVQWLAHGKILVAIAISKHPKGSPDLLHLPLTTENLMCAFFDCNDRGYHMWGDRPETGTLVWLASAVLVLVFFTRAYRGGKL